MTDKETWHAIRRRFGDGSMASIRSIAEEFGQPEATVRRRSHVEAWSRDLLRDQLHNLRREIDYLEVLIDRRVGGLVPRDGQ